MSSGTSGSSQAPNSGSEEEFKALMDQKKRKRMQSNRDSARRSRMRKQQHLDELMAQVSQLREENGQILTSLNITTQQYLGVEAENSVLRIQMMELSTRLQSLNEILHCMNANNTSNYGLFPDGPQFNDSFINPWNFVFKNQPIMASMDMFQYC